MMHESDFLQNARRFQTSIDDSVISMFGIGSLRAKFNQQQIGPSGYVFGGHVASLLAMWAAAKFQINAGTDRWGFEAYFLKPAPVGREFITRLNGDTLSAAVFSDKFATLKINDCRDNPNLLSLAKPTFRTHFDGLKGTISDQKLLIDLPSTRDWHEMLYYVVASCDWGIWVLGQLYYPTATFISASLNISFTERLSAGPITLALTTIIPNANKKDRVEIVVSILNSKQRAIGSASATLVNFDYNDKKKLAFPVCANC